MLATAAREGLSDDEELRPELRAAVNAYKRSLKDDDNDEILQRSTRALSACTDDRCAGGALDLEGFGRGFVRALPVFLETHWLARAKTAWVGVEAAHAAMAERGDTLTALHTRVAGDLGVRLPADTDRSIRIDVVSETPPVGREAFLPIALATRGRCFTSEQEQLRQGHPAPSEQREHVHHARILDCVLVHALLNADAVTPIRVALVQLLGNKQGERAWTLLVIHAVAATVTGWEPRHLSVYRRSATAVEPQMLEWLVQQWHGRPSGDPDDFPKRYAAQWRDTRAPR